MALWKRGKWYWIDVVVNSERVREPLHTTDWREATRLERERVDQLERRPTVPTANSRAYAAMAVVPAITAYAHERRAQVSPRMVAYWLENAKPLGEFFKATKLRQIIVAQLTEYQNARTDAGRAPKTINGELSVLRQVLKRARLWHRFAEDYTPLKNRKPPVGQALTVEQQERLFTLAKSRPAWLFAYVASTLSFYCGMRACEIRALRWKDIELGNALLHVRRSKTPAGWRSPTLNATCLDVVGYLRSQSAALGFAQPEHFVFPWHGRNKRIDPTRGMTSWRTAWRSIRKAAGLTEFRFHDGRHTAITTLAEKGTADWVIQAQVGHVAPEMMKTYSHIRRQALNAAAAALEPPKPPTPADPPTEPPNSETAQPEAVMSQTTSQSASSTGRVLKFARKSGSPVWTVFATGSSMQHDIWKPLVTQNQALSTTLMKRRIKIPHGSIRDRVRLQTDAQ